MFKALDILTRKWVEGYYLPKGVLTGDNFCGYLETYEVVTGPLIVDIDGIAYRVIEESVCRSIDIKDNEGNTLYQNDILLTSDGKKLFTLAASHYVVGAPGLGNKPMTAILCEMDGGESIFQLIQRSDDTWIVENSIKSVTIKVIDNLYGPIE